MKLTGFTDNVKKDFIAFVNSKRKGLDIYSNFTGDNFLIEVFRYEEYYPEKGTLITNVDPNFDPSTKKMGKEISAAELNLSSIIKKEKQIKERRIFPIAKILKIGDSVSEDYKNYKVGDIVRISDSLLKAKQNPAWEEWYEKTNGGEARGIEAIQPPRFIYNFELFALNNSLKENPFSPADAVSVEDMFTYYVSSNYIKCKMDCKSLIG